MLWCSDLQSNLASAGLNPVKVPAVETQVPPRKSSNTIHHMGPSTRT